VRLGCRPSLGRRRLRAADLPRNYVQEGGGIQLGNGKKAKAQSEP